MEIDRALTPTDWQAGGLDKPPRQRAWLIALLVSLALHGVLWIYAGRAEILRRDSQEQDLAAVMTLRLTKKLPLVEPVDDDVAEMASPPAPQPAIEQLPALPDAPPHIAPATPPRPLLRDSLPPAMPTDAPPDNADPAAGVIFDPRLRRKLRDFRYERPITAPDDRVYFDNYGEEWVRQGDTCSKVIDAVDHQDQSLLAIPTRCKGAADENDFERGFRERLRARGLK